MTIGIPRAFLYYKYGTLWEAFFNRLGVKYILSPETNARILGEGRQSSVDESCLPAKIYAGHAAALIGKCDYIFIPRVENLGKGKSDVVCVRFFAAYDVIQNTFAARLKASGTKLLDCNVDIRTGITEEKAFIRLGKSLGFGRRVSFAAYREARAAQNDYDARKNRNSLELLCSDKPKILVIGHPYNIYDPLIGAPVTRFLERAGMAVILANEFDETLCRGAAARVSERLYWAYNKELAGAAALYAGGADGLVFITAFPCGPDSLVTELMLRKFRGVPKLNLIVDELQSEAGLNTRLESFCDIILNKREAV